MLFSQGDQMKQQAWRLPEATVCVQNHTADTPDLRPKEPDNALSTDSRKQYGEHYAHIPKRW
ncbi:hypothetical protein STEG23_024773, partial [Scotinomys teguina]